MIKIIKFFLLLLPKGVLKQLYLLLFFVFIGSLFEILSFGTFIPILDIVLNQKNAFLNNFEILNNFLSENNKVYQLFYISLFLLIIFSIKNLYLIFLNYFISRFTNNVRLYYNQLYLKEIYLKPFSFHLNNDSAKILRDNLGEINAITKNLIFPTIVIFLDLITFFGLIILLIYNDPSITLTIVVVLILFSTIYISFFKNKLDNHGKNRIFGEQKKIQTVLESLRLIKNIILKRKSDFFVNKYKLQDLLTVKASVFNTVVTNSVRYFLEILMIFFIFILIVYGIFFDYSFEKLFSSAFLVSLFFVRIFPSFNKLIILINNYNFFSKTVDNIYKNISKYYLNIKLNDEIKIINKTDFKEKLELKNISFSYNENKLIDNFNLDIEKNKITVISGKNASGKSTLLNIILGLLKPQFGKYYIDKKVIDIDKINLSKLIGLVPQDINLLDDTLVNNIAFGEINENINLDMIIKLSKELEFDNKLIEHLNNKDFNIGENGNKLSGGQRQKIVLARAFYDDPEVLILDEPTSAFDSINKSLFKKLINNYKGAKTFIIVSHDFDIIKLSDNHYKI